MINDYVGGLIILFAKMGVFPTNVKKKESRGGILQFTIGLFFFLMLIF